MTEKPVFGNNFPIARSNRNPYRSNSLTLEEQERLFAILTDLGDTALFKLALSTGVRREDIVRIEIGRIDFANRRLTFWRPRSAGTGRFPSPRRWRSSLTGMRGRGKGKSASSASQAGRPTISYSAASRRPG